MSGKRSVMGDIAVEYCKQYPQWKDLTLARKVWKENTGHFKNTEQARAAIRYYRNHHGNKSRGKDKGAASGLSKELTHDTTNQKVYKDETITGAKILILDIETAPIKSYVWNIWNQNISLNAIESDWFMLTWAAKWLFEDKVYSGMLRPEEVLNEDDSRIVASIWEMVNEADIVIAHNGKKFDMPKLNSRFIINGLMPPLPYQLIDTMEHIRRQFGFTSNKLDYVNQLLHLPRKIENEGMPLWIKCLKGDAEALQTMHDYNVGDVRILEETYLRIRPWIRPHPSVALFLLDEAQHRCPTCGSSELIDQGKNYYTNAGVYPLLRCNNCGATGRKRLSDVNIKQKRHLLISTAK